MENSQKLFSGKYFVYLGTVNIMNKHIALYAIKIHKWVLLMNFADIYCSDF